MNSPLQFALLLTCFALNPGDAYAISEPGVEKHAQTISIWIHSGVNSGEYSAVEQTVALYNASHPKQRVELFPSTFRSYEAQIDSAAASASLPCILEADGPNLYTLIWRGYLQPIERFLPKSLLDDLLPSILAQGRYDGRLYGLGQFDSGLALWGNRRLLREAGIRIPSLKSPWTLDEFELALNKLSRLPGVRAAIDMGTYMHSSEFYSYAYAPIIQGFGGDLIDRSHFNSAKGVLDGPEAVKAMTHFQQWFSKGFALAHAVLTEADTSRVVALNRLDQSSADDFIKGRVALSWAGHWQYRWYKQGLDDDLILLPLPDFGRGIKTGMGSWSWAISSTCKNPKLAADFLKALMSEKAILRMTLDNGAIPARRSLLAKSPLYGESGPLRLYAEQIKAGLAVPRPNTPAYAAISKAFSNAAALIIAGADVQSELSRAAALIEQNIAENRGYPND